RRHAPGARELANVAPEQLARKRACALERDFDGVGARVRIAVEVAADPGPEPRHGGGLRRALSQFAEKIRGRLPERLLEVPEAVPNLVDDVRSPRPHLVRLPE